MTGNGDTEGRKERTTLLIVVLLVVLLALGAVSIVTLIQQNHISHNADKLATAQVAFCERVQTLRDAVNLHTLADYDRALAHGNHAEQYTYEPPTDCALAIQSANFEPAPRVSFWTVACRFTTDHPRPAITPVCPHP